MLANERVKEHYRENKMLLLTGASGFMGERAIPFGLRNYPAVFVADINPITIPFGTRESGKLFVQESNLTNRDSLKMLRIRVEEILSQHPGMRLVIWHMGGAFNYLAPMELLDAVNRGGTVNLVEEVALPLIDRLDSFVHWSGLTEFGDFVFEGPATEESVRIPTNDYGWSKYYATESLGIYQRVCGLPVVSMKLPMVYGPGGPIDRRYGFAPSVKMLSKGAPNLIVKNLPRGAPAIHVEDVMRVAHFLGNCEQAQGQSFIVRDTTLYESEDISLFLGEALGSRLKIWVPEFIFRHVIIRLMKLIEKIKPPTNGLDSGLAEVSLVDASCSNEKLMLLAQAHGRGQNGDDPLFRYPDTKDGLKVAFKEMEEEGWIKIK